YDCSYFHHSFSLSLNYSSNNFALIATIIVLKLIKIAPTAGLNTIPIGANTPAASGIENILYPVAHHMFCTILRYIFYDMLLISCLVINQTFCIILKYVIYKKYMSAITSFGSLLTRSMSVVSISTTVPSTIAIPKSAVASAVASLLPSLVIAT